MSDSLIDSIFRHGIGYETLARFHSTLANASNYPPHSIHRLPNEEYRLTLAVAGYTKDEISITLHNGLLTISGAKAHTDVDDGVECLYRGIAFRDFTRQFSLGEHVVVREAKLENGLLVVVLHREVPEALKPLAIPVL